jgi:glucokinase
VEAAAGTVIAVDVGGTRIKAAVIDAAGRVRRELARPTPAERGPEAVVNELEAVVRELAAPPESADWAVQAVAVVVPGIVDAAAGRAEFSANLGFRGLPLRDRIETAAGLPTVLGHDVGAAGVAEMTVGITQGVGDYLLAVIGTGISGVIRAAGQPLRGARGMAGELGHVPVVPGGRPCPCGQRGCLERYAAAPAIARRYAELGGEAGLSAREVAARRDSDPAAEAAWREAVEALAVAFATCTMLLDPELIVLAGGLSDAGDGLADPVRAELAARVTWREPPAVRISPLRGRAGLVGAAVLAWRRLGIDPAGRWSAAA